jgi:hypothetical protein
MKKPLLLILAIIILIALGQYLYKKFIDKPKIIIDIYGDRILTQKKIFYKINYSGVEFSGVYDLNSKNAQTEKTGEYKIKTISNGLIFGLQVLKNDQVINAVLFDIAKQKITLNL